MIFSENWRPLFRIMLGVRFGRILSCRNLSELRCDFVHGGRAGIARLRQFGQCAAHA
jgi:hypothetical protein